MQQNQMIDFSAHFNLICVYKWDFGAISVCKGLRMVQQR